MKPVGADRARIYWYWPFPNGGTNPVADRLVDLGFAVTMESLATHLGVPIEGGGTRYRVVRDLPEVSRVREGSARWALDRAGAYVERARRRSRAIRGGTFDVAHLHVLNIFTDPAALRVLRRRVPVVATVHDVVPHERRLTGVLERGLLRAMYHVPDALVVLHEAVGDQLESEFGVSGDRIAVVRQQIDDRHFGPNAVVSRPSQPGEPLHVLFFGVLRRNKGIETLVRAIDALDADTEVRFTIAGRGVDELEQLVRRAADRHRNVNAEIGYVDPLRKDQLYQSADLVVMPYTSMQSQSAVLGDAYAYRVPVVATDVGAVGPTVRADGTGWVVPPGDAPALAEALENAMADSAARLRARQAMDDAVGRHRADTIAERLAELYDRVVARAHTP